MMKRIAVLLVVLLAGFSFYGCGSKGTSSNDSSSTSNPGGGSQPSTITAFTLNLVDNASRVVSFGTGTTPTDVRVVIRRYNDVGTPTQVCSVYSQVNFDQDGNPVCDLFTTVTVTTFTEVWKDIQDVPYSNSISVGIPAGSGYTLDVITSLYSSSSGSHRILKYGQTPNVTVPGGGSATVTMNAVPAILNMSVTDPATSKGQFVVSLNNALPFNPTYQLTLNFNNIVDINTNATVTTMLVTSVSNTTTLTAPGSYTSGQQINVSAQFTLNSAFLKSNDTSVKWTRVFPDIAFGESAYGPFNPLISVGLPGI